MVETRTDTSIYMYAFCDNWTTRPEVKKANFDNLYLGDFEYRHYNCFNTKEDFDKFLADNCIFALLSEDRNNDYDSLVEILAELKQTIAHYDVTLYGTNPDTDEFVNTDFRRTMFVFEVTGKHKDALFHFKKSEYSKMYEPATVNSLFSNHTQYYMKLLTNKGDILLTESNVETILAERSLEKEVNNFKASYAHIMRKSPQLKAILEKIYAINLSPDAELKSRLKWEKEIYNYQKVVDEQALKELLVEPTQ